MSRILANALFYFEAGKLNVSDEQFREQGEQAWNNLFESLNSRCTGYLSYCVVPRSTDRCKALHTSNDHIVISAGAVDDEQFSACVPAANDAHMGIIRVEYQVTGLCVRPRNIGAIAVLHGGASAVADNIAAAGLIVENPIHK